MAQEPVSIFDENADSKRAISVSAAMARAKAALEKLTLTVIGEVTEVSDKPGYKACYFSIADAGATMSCLMWRDRYLATGITIKRGDKIEITGRFSAYAAKGRMNFTVTTLKLAGEGTLREKVARLAQKLKEQGLMDPARKRTLPTHPERVALVTSPRGKAVHDVIRTLRRRNASIELLVAGVAVEGVDAPQKIIEGLRVAASSRPDVILLVRGGGSFEDLMPFNDEAVARAIAACEVPIVTGIGHEPDTTIADMVSDFRASTPTAAAEAVAISAQDELRRLAVQQAQMTRALRNKLMQYSERVERLATRPVIARPIDSITARFLSDVNLSKDRLDRAIPESLKRDQETFVRLRDKFMATRQNIFAALDKDLYVQAGKLESLSPLAVLARGYSYAYTVDQFNRRIVVDSILRVKQDESLTVVLSDGEILTKVVDVEPRSS